MPSRRDALKRRAMGAINEPGDSPLPQFAMGDPPADDRYYSTSYYSTSYYSTSYYSTSYYSTAT